MMVAKDVGRPIVMEQWVGWPCVISLCFVDVRDVSKVQVSRRQITHGVGRSEGRERGDVGRFI